MWVTVTVCVMWVFFGSCNGRAADGLDRLEALVVLDAKGGE